MPTDVRGSGYDAGAIKKISIVIPVYNERNTLQEVVRRSRAAELPCPREIVIVDDGSTDGSVQIAKGMEDSTVRAVIQPQNQGKGAAVRKGIEVATGDYVLIQDADLEYDPSDWQKLVAPILAGKATVVYGSRFTGERRNMMFWHWIGNRFLSLITNVLYNTTLSDMETCYKLAPTETLRSLNLKANRFDFEPELTAKLLRSKVRIYEVPISYAGREFDEGKKITWKDGFAALWTLVKYRFEK